MRDDEQGNLFVVSRNLKRTAENWYNRPQRTQRNAEATSFLFFLCVPLWLNITYSSQAFDRLSYVYLFGQVNILYGV